MVPYGEGISPQTIREEDELERLAGMQLRDSLVRGLGLSDQLQVTLKNGFCSHFIQSEAGAQPPKSNLFTCRYHLDHEQNPGAATTSSLSVKHHTPSEHEQRLLGMARATPLHSLPGTLSTVKMNESSALGQPQQQNHWPTSKHTLHQRRQAHTSVQSLSATYYKPSPTGTHRYTIAMVNKVLSNVKVIIDTYPPPPPSYNRYLQQLPKSILHRCQHPRQQQSDPTCLASNSELLGLSVISAPIRLATRHYPQSNESYSCELSTGQIKGRTEQHSTMAHRNLALNKMKQLGMLAAHIHSHPPLPLPP